MAVAAGELVLSSVAFVAALLLLLLGAIGLVAAVPAVVLFVAQPPRLDALAVRASELVGSARLIWRVTKAAVSVRTDLLAH